MMEKPGERATTQLVLYFLAVTLIFGCSTTQRGKSSAGSIKQKIAARNTDSFKGPKPVWDVKLGDFDQDGTMDLAVLSKYEKLMLVFDLSGKRTTFSEKTLCYRPVSMVIDNFDGDKRQEIVLLTESGVGSYFKVTGNGTIEQCRLSFKSVGRMWKLEALELPGNPLPGLVAGGSGLMLLCNQGHMNFKEQVLKLPSLSSSGFLSKRIADRAFRSLEAVSDLNGDGYPELIATDYYGRDVWLLYSFKKSYRMEKIFHFTGASPLYGSMVIDEKEPIWLIVMDYPGQILLLKGQESVKEQMAIDLPGRAAAASVADINGDGCRDLMVFVENKTPERPGFIYFYYGICKASRYILEKGPVLETGIFTTMALSYQEPFLAVADYKSGRVEIFQKGRDF